MGTKRYIYYSTLLIFIYSKPQGTFSKKPSVFVTAAHHNAGLKRDAASVWLENITQSISQNMFEGTAELRRISWRHLRCKY